MGAEPGEQGRQLFSLKGNFQGGISQESRAATPGSGGMRVPAPTGNLGSMHSSGDTVSSGVPWLCGSSLHLLGRSWKTTDGADARLCGSCLPLCTGSPPAQEAVASDAFSTGLSS